VRRATRTEPGPRRSATAKSWRRRSRAPAGSTRTLRQTVERGPWSDGRRGSIARRGCAYAAGSRGSWHAGGCSAGRCACSLGGSRVGGWTRRRWRSPADSAAPGHRPGSPSSGTAGAARLGTRERACGNGRRRSTAPTVRAG
jgi:hypothetical protein